MAFTITTIRRAVFFNGVSSAYRAQLPPLSEVWQSVQFKLNEAAKKPMVPKNWSTEIPRSTWMFLKASSAICGFSACPCAPVMVNRHTASVAAAQRIAPLDPNFMSPPLTVLARASMARDQIARIDSLGFCVWLLVLPPNALLASTAHHFALRLDTIHSPALHTQSAPQNRGGKLDPQKGRAYATACPEVTFPAVACKIRSTAMGVETGEAQCENDGPAPF